MDDVLYLLIDERTSCAIPTRETWSRLSVLLPCSEPDRGRLKNEIVDPQIEGHRPRDLARVVNQGTDVPRLGPADGGMNGHRHIKVIHLRGGHDECCPADEVMI